MKKALNVLRHTLAMGLCLPLLFVQVACTTSMEDGGMSEVRDVSEISDSVIADAWQEESQYSQSDNAENAAENATVLFRPASDVVRDISVGWNVGNSLDSYGDWINGSTPTDYETAWSNPVITKELIQCVKAEGFNAVRIPVTYLHFMDENGTIDEVWLTRIKEVVDYVVQEEMYCIIDMHHDTGASDSAWIVADPYLYENGMKDKFAYAWQQIAEYFKEYDDRLMFEGMNEVLDSSWNWGGSSEENYRVINALNQTFVDTVRATGGNNAERNLIVVAYGNSSHESQISGFVPPTDSADGHLIIGIHVYEPDAFCNGTDDTWDQNDEVLLQNAFDRINRNIIQKYQLPVIVGEFGARDVNDSPAFREERAKFAQSFIEKAETCGIACFWWDDGWNMKLFDRSAAVVYDAVSVGALVNASKK